MILYQKNFLRSNFVLATDHFKLNLTQITDMDFLLLCVINSNTVNRIQFRNNPFSKYEPVGTFFFFCHLQTVLSNQLMLMLMHFNKLFKSYGNLALIWYSTFNNYSCS